MEQERFAAAVGAGHTRIPLVREVLADMDTPLSVYMKLANRPMSYLFESVHGGERWGRYSFIGLPARSIIRVFGRRIECLDNGVVTDSFEHPDPLSWIEQFHKQFQVPEIAGLPRFAGGLVGYFGFETVSLIESRLQAEAKPDVLGMPDILLMVSEELVVFDSLTCRLYIIVHADPQQPDALQAANARLDELERRLGEALPLPRTASHPHAVPQYTTGWSAQSFQEAVAKAQRYIVDGDIMQVVLAQRMSVPFSPPPDRKSVV